MTDPLMPQQLSVKDEPLALEEVRKIDAYWRAALYLCVGHDLPPRQSAAPGAPRDRARQEAAPRPLGDRPRPDLRLGAPQPPDQEARPEHDLHLRPRPRRPRRPLQRLPGRHLLRGLSGQERGRGRHEEILQAVLLPRRHRQPLHAGDPGLASTKAASWATASPTPSAPPSTIPI